jgi:Rieske 2Fe-2S family protein
VLCEADSGTFAGGRIVCPYHAWTYTLDGNLERVPRLRESAVVRREDFPLYRVALQNWRGFVFVNLGAGHRGGEPAQTLRDALGDEAAAVQAWPLEDLRRAHRIRHRLACNWKIYWENYLECYHCPGVHPQLCKLVPVYRTGYMDYAAAGLEPDPERPGSMLNPGAVTWSVGGATALPWFDGLGERERRAGMTFATFLPTMFLVAHVDYVRTVRILPLGPEQTELTVDWYVQRDVIGHPQLDVERLSEFGNLVVTQDARVCELNQQGIRCSRHERGVLLAQEDHVYEFEQWVRARLDDARS